jgi:hypothetical protein
LAAGRAKENKTSVQTKKNNKKIRSISGQLPQTPAGRREQKSLETLAFPFPPRSLSLAFFLFSPLLAAVLFGDQTT